MILILAEMSSHFMFPSENMNIHNINNNKPNKILLLETTDMEAEFSINRKLEILQIFALKLHMWERWPGYLIFLLLLHLLP